MHASGGTPRAVAPTVFVRNTRALVPSFRQQRQEDAHECVRGLLDAMIRGEVFGCGGFGTARWAVETSTAVHRVFGGALQSSVVCTECRYASVTSEPFLDLSLEMANLNSVPAALAKFTAAETLRGDNRYRCGACNKLVVAMKRLCIRRAPNVLTLHVKRFTRTNKDMRFIDFPEQLDVGKYMYGKPPRLRALYRLSGVIVHIGLTRASGHYVAYVKAMNGSWTLKDDSVSRTVPLSTVLRQRAYVLLYSRVEEALDVQLSPGKATSAPYGMSASTRPTLTSSPQPRRPASGGSGPAPAPVPLAARGLRNAPSAAPAYVTGARSSPATRQPIAQGGGGTPTCRKVDGGPLPGSSLALHAASPARAAVGKSFVRTPSQLFPSPAPLLAKPPASSEAADKQDNPLLELSSESESECASPSPKRARAGGSPVRSMSTPPKVNGDANSTGVRKPPSPTRTGDAAKPTAAESPAAAVAAAASAQVHGGTPPAPGQPASEEPTVELPRVPRRSWPRWSWDSGRRGSKSPPHDKSASGGPEHGGARRRNVVIGGSGSARKAVKRVFGMLQGNGRQERRRSSPEVGGQGSSGSAAEGAHTPTGGTGGKREGDDGASASSTGKASGRGSGGVCSMAGYCVGLVDKEAQKEHERMASPSSPSSSSPPPPPPLERHGARASALFGADGVDEWGGGDGGEGAASSPGQGEGEHDGPGGEEDAVEVEVEDAASASPAPTASRSASGRSASASGGSASASGSGSGSSSGRGSGGGRGSMFRQRIVKRRRAGDEMDADYDKGRPRRVRASGGGGAAAAAADAVRNVFEAAADRRWGMSHSRPMA